MDAKKTVLLLIFTTLLLGCTSSKPAPAPQREPKSLAKANSYSGPIDDCAALSQLYWRKNDLAADCTPNYVHIYPARPPSNTAAQSALRIGSFNLYHLGDNQSPFKNIALVAEIMNQWDLVGAQELMTFNAAEAENNRLVYQTLKAHGGKLPGFRGNSWNVETPGYLRLLFALRELDPSWAVLLQATPSGEGAGEMAGFYYRSSRVLPHEWSYCPESGAEENGKSRPNLACLIGAKEEQLALVSRLPFAAFFKAGNFDFVALTAHVRFRPASAAADRAAQATELCANSTAESCNPSQIAVGRFYEVKVAADQIPSLKASAQDSDIIYMGDFNLEISNAFAPFWAAALHASEGLVPFQSAPTSLSVVSNTLASNYDHFLLNPSLTTECDTASIRAFDFTSATTDHPNPALAKLALLLSDPDKIDQQLADDKNALRQYVTAQKRRSGVKIRAVSEADVENLHSSVVRAAERMKRGKFAAYMELISDHIPVEMNCATDQPDRD